jgi:hypothetical protein
MCVVSALRVLWARVFPSHIHCVIPSGGLSSDHQRWVHPGYPFFLPVKVLSRVSRGKFIAGLKRTFQHRKLSFQGNLKPLSEPKQFHAFLPPLFRQDWVVYAKRPFGGPQHVVQYLVRYTHRVSISNTGSSEAAHVAWLSRGCSRPSRRRPAICLPGKQAASTPRPPCGTD